MNKSNKKRIVIASIVSIIAIVFLVYISVKSPVQTPQDDYASYFVAVTNKAKNLTDEYQHAIVIKELGNSSNSTIAKITENYLPKFVAQFNEFNSTLTSTKYAKAKENLARSFDDEIKSYEHYKTYLLTNNSTENDISTDYLSSSLKYETLAFKEFYSAVRNK